MNFRTLTTACLLFLGGGLFSKEIVVANTLSFNDAKVGVCSLVMEDKCLKSRKVGNNPADSVMLQDNNGVVWNLTMVNMELISKRAGVAPTPDIPSGIFFSDAGMRLQIVNGCFRTAPGTRDEEDFHAVEEQPNAEPFGRWGDWDQYPIFLNFYHSYKPILAFEREDIKAHFINHPDGQKPMWSYYGNLWDPAKNIYPIGFYPFTEMPEFHSKPDKNGNHPYFVKGVIHANTPTSCRVVPGKADGWVEDGYSPAGYHPLEPTFSNMTTPADIGLTYDRKDDTGISFEIEAGSNQFNVYAFEYFFDDAEDTNLYAPRVNVYYDKTAVSKSGNVESRIMMQLLDRKTGAWIKSGRDCLFLDGRIDLTKYRIFVQFGVRARKNCYAKYKFNFSCISYTNFETVKTLLTK